MLFVIRILYNESLYIYIYHYRWAVIKDKDVYEKVSRYITVADLGISKDTQLRVLKLLKVAVEGDGKQLFKFAYDKMRQRWDRLTSVFSKSTRFSIQKRDPLHCNFFNETRLPSPGNVTFYLCNFDFYDETIRRIYNMTYDNHCSLCMGKM